MSKNYKIHLRLESEFVELLRKEAIENNTTLSDICRKKLNEIDRLKKIEFLLCEVLKQLKK